MARYLNPKVDVVFKKIFGQHPDILKSFLNAVLPLAEERRIVELTYLPSEQVPQIPDFKNTIADVKCTDDKGHVFIVEMQIRWTSSFYKRLVFGAGQAYVSQLRKGDTYQDLKEVFAIGLIDAVIDSQSPHWYHHYKITHQTEADKTINEIQFLFIELPKFKAQSLVEKKIQILWLRFLAELDEQTTTVPEEWLTIPEIGEALLFAEESAYSPDEINAYNKYWDAVSTQRTFIADAKTEGRAEGKIAGKIEGKIETAKNMIAEGIELTLIAKITQLPIEHIEKLASHKQM